MVISPDMNYVITYSESDNSICGWLIDIETNKQQQHHMFILDEPYQISSFVLYYIKKFYYSIIMYYHDIDNKIKNDHDFRKYLIIIPKDDAKKEKVLIII